MLEELRGRGGRKRMEHRYREDVARGRVHTGELQVQQTAFEVADQKARVMQAGWQGKKGRDEAARKKALERERLQQQHGWKPGQKRSDSKRGHGPGGLSAKEKLADRGSSRSLRY